LLTSLLPHDIVDRKRVQWVPSTAVVEVVYLSMGEPKST